MVTAWSLIEAHLFVQKQDLDSGHSLRLPHPIEPYFRRSPKLGQIWGRRRVFAAPVFRK